MASTYRQLEDNVWYPVAKQGNKLACCDCGLVHIVQFRIRNGKVQMKLHRHQRATGQRRRQMKKVNNEIN